jgi:CRISPR-associated endoribonuclease Cas6
MRKYTAAPHPFVLHVPWGQANAVPSEEGAYDLGLTLIGQGADYLPYLVIAFKTAGEHGVGPGRIRMHLESVKQADPPESDHWVEIFKPGEILQARSVQIPKRTEPPVAVQLRFMTPTRLIRQGRLVGPDDFRFSDLFSSLLRRVSLLSYFHTEKPLAVNFAELTARSGKVSLTKVRLAWMDWARYSSRQQTNIKMGGIMGEVTCSLEGAESLWPYVWLGRWIHAGKGTSMGLGCYTVDSASLS